MLLPHIPVQSHFNVARLPAPPQPCPPSLGSTACLAQLLMHYPAMLNTRRLKCSCLGLCSIAKTCKWLAFGFGAVGAALVAWRLSGGVVTLLRRKRLRCAAVSEQLISHMAMSVPEMDGIAAG